MKLKLTLALVVLLLSAYWIISHSFLIVSTTTALAALAIIAVALWLLYGGNK